MRKLFFLLMMLMTLGCTQQMQFAPKPTGVNFLLSNIPIESTNVEIVDLRSEREGSDALQSTLRGQILAALGRSQRPTLDKYLLKIDIIEHRSYFTLGNWNGITRLRASVADSKGNLVGSWEAKGEGHRSNMWGYATAEAVSQDSYNAAVADLMSLLSTVTLK